MDDLISRQAAIKWCKPEDWGTPDERWRPESEYGAMLEALPPAEPQWIPVTERLPEPYSGEYLVTINDGSVYTDILWFDSPGDGRYESCFYKTDDDGYGVVCDDVTAWMPLPIPWEGESDERM